MNKVNKATIDLMKGFEGLSLKAYHDSIDPPNTDTIGYGTVVYPPYYLGGKSVKVGDPDITEAQADDFFMYEANEKAAQLSKIINATINDNQFGAILSFTYEEGLEAFENSTLHKKIEINPKDPSIQLEFDKWVYADHKKVQGIENRRKAEWQLYITPVN